MLAKLLLYVSAHQATVACWRAGKLSLCQDFANSEEGWHSLGNFLQYHPRTPVYMLVDAVEEDYRTETMPHAFGSARQEMLSRKLKQIYRNTPYSAASPQGRNKDQRRDDRYLFTAMTNPDILRPWLEILRGRQLPLAGIYLLPMVSQTLLAKLKINSPNLLLVSEHSAGLRQSFFQNQQLKISRLTPLQPAGDVFIEAFPGSGGEVSHYTDEVEKTRYYLNSLRLVTREDRLDVCILDQSDSLGELFNTLKNDPGLQCFHLNKADIFKRLDISPDTFTSSCIVAPHLLVLGSQPPAASLAPPALSRGFSLYQARLALFGMSAAAALAAITWSGANLALQQTAEKKTQQLTAQTLQQESLYNEVAQQFPEAPTSAENLLKAVEIAQKMREASRTPELMMKTVSLAMDANPSITLNRLKWKHSNQTSDPEEASSQQQTSPANMAGTENPPSNKKWQIGYIEGEIKPFSGDYRAAINDINTFAASLKKNDAVADVAILQLPLNVNSGSGLSGTTLEKDTQAASAKFKVKVLLK